MKPRYDPSPTSDFLDFSYSTDAVSFSSYIFMYTFNATVTSAINYGDALDCSLGDRLRRDMYSILLLMDKWINSVAYSTITGTKKSLKLPLRAFYHDE